jgi:hypothetical protein
MSTLLTNRHSKYILWLAGGCFTLVGLLTLSMGELATLKCQRTNANTGQCHLTQSGLLGLVAQQTISLAELQEATVDRRSDRKSGWSYRVLLHTETEVIPLSQTYIADRAQKEAIALQINTLIVDSSQSSLDIRQDNRLYYSLAGGLFLSIACLSLLSGRTKA